MIGPRFAQQAESVIPDPAERSSYAVPHGATRWSKEPVGAAGAWGRSGHGGDRRGVVVLWRIGSGDAVGHE